MLQVFSIFESVQGESSFQGIPTCFVRLAGCPLDCIYCDTRLACEADGEPLSVDDIVNRVCSSGLPCVEVTGGEPLFQKETVALLQSLAASSLKVLLETSGGFSVEGLDPRVHIIMDVKCPGSGMSDRLFPENLSLIRAFDHELKFVLSSEDDFLWALDFCKNHQLLDRHLLFSPATGLVSPADLAGWMVEHRLDARLQLQLHKIIWPDAKEER